MLLMTLKKTFFKLIINSVYGKTIENLRKVINARLVNNKKDFLKHSSRPTYVTHKLFDKDYAAIHEIKPVLVLNKPIYVGFTVLDLSKSNMYDFHYNFINKKFDAELLFTGTGSLVYEIKSENVYEEFLKWKDMFEIVIIVIILKIKSFLMILIKKLLAKWNMNIVELL